MNIYIWRHSKAYSSWSMLDEPHIVEGHYMEAEVTVLAPSENDALHLLEQEGRWNVEDLKRIRPLVISLDQPMVLTSNVR